MKYFRSVWFFIIILNQQVIIAMMIVLYSFIKLQGRYIKQSHLWNTNNTVYRNSFHSTTSVLSQLCTDYEWSKLVHDVGWLQIKSLMLRISMKCLRPPARPLMNNPWRISFVYNICYVMLSEDSSPLLHPLATICYNSISVH